MTRIVGLLLAFSRAFVLAASVGAVVVLCAWTTRRHNPNRLRGRAAVARRARILARDPICRICRVRLSTIADHIVNLAVSGKDDRLVTDEEMQGICQPCSDSKTASENTASRLVRRRAPEAHPGDVTGPGGGSKVQRARSTEPALVGFSNSVRVFGGFSGGLVSRG